MPRTRALPNDVETLKRLLAERDAALELIRAQLHSKTVEIERLRLELAQLRRMKFGRSSEQLDEKIAQLELRLEALEAEEASAPVAQAVPAIPREKPARRPLPADRACTCPDCGGAIRALGEDISEVLEYVPSRFKVIRHVRPKMSCRVCEKIVQALTRIGTLYAIENQIRERPAEQRRAVRQAHAGPLRGCDLLAHRHCKAQRPRSGELSARCDRADCRAPDQPCRRATALEHQSATRG